MHISARGAFACTSAGYPHLCPATDLLHAPFYHVQAAVDSVVASLQQLERQLPGASARLLSEAMLQLSINDSSQLGKLLASARCIFGAASGNSGDGGGNATPVVTSAGVQAGPTPAPAATPLSTGARIGVGAGTPGAAAAAVLGSDVAVGSRAGPDLGMLGHFLLARWREDAARTAAAAARTRAGFLA